MNLVRVLDRDQSRPHPLPVGPGPQSSPAEDLESKPAVRLTGGKIQSSMEFGEVGELKLQPNLMRAVMKI